MTSPHFQHLQSRCNLLIERFLEPAIAASRAAIEAEVPGEVPIPNFDDFAAFRLLTHAELEGYFEAKARERLITLDSDFRAGRVLTANFFSLISLHMWKTRLAPAWPEATASDASYLKSLAQNAIGFGRQFIETNNGIKEASIHVLSALMGYFPDDLDPLLVNELNQYGKKRGDVAHSSWTYNTRTFDSAEIEKARLTKIIDLTRAFYES